MRPDELVLLGAPGLGVHEVADLHLGPGAGLWAGAADGDAVSLLARAGWVHGPDPLGVAVRLPTSLAGHGRYLDDPVPHTGPPVDTIPQSVRDDAENYVLIALRPSDFQCHTPL